MEQAEIATAPAALLATDKLVKEYRQRRVVNGVSIWVGGGEIVGLLGPNGAGKTTTFNMVVGVIKSESGTVRFQGRDITRLPMHRRARQAGEAPQAPSLDEVKALLARIAQAPQSTYAAVAKGIDVRIGRASCRERV